MAAVMKKQIAIRSAIGFIIVMVFFTFSSKTIQYFMMPKVMAQMPESGYIETSYTFNGVKAFSDEAHDSVIKLMADYQAGQEEKFKEGTPCTIFSGRNSINGKIEGYFTVQGAKRIVIAPEFPESSEPSDSESLIDIQDQNIFISIVLPGEYYDCIIPNTAFVTPDEVFLLKSMRGFWGEEYFIERRRVVAGVGNGFRTQVLSGMRNAEMVVTGWDRELIDGARVTLPLN